MRGAATATPPPPDVFLLDAPSNTDEYARVLYARMREADARGVDVLVAVVPPAHGVGTAVADRLRRAATVALDGEGWDPGRSGR
jgi:L-threonylcarbamoyladenylate synthase